MAALCTLFAVLSLVVCCVREPVVESTARLANPGIGFYRTAPFSLTPDGGGNMAIYQDYNLHHLRVNIGAFSQANNGTADLALTTAALNKLEENIDKLYQREKCAVIRFAYDNFNGVADLEPSEDMILQHIAQVSPILNRYPQTITAIEVGLVGKWGEMHTSKLANKDTISKLIDKFLTCTQDIPILVRTPAMIYHYLGITLNDLDTYQIPQTSPAYHRLGIFNDGYLGSSSDLGTYTNREREVAWLSQQTAYLPYGGEVMTGAMSNIENCLPEMRQMHLSYLNYEWNTQTTWQKWTQTFYTAALGDDSAYYGATAQRYIENHLGYRFLVTKRQLQVSHGKLYLTMQVQNVGFGNLTKVAHASVIMVNQAGQTWRYAVDDFTGQGTYNLRFKHELPRGKYQVYYCPHLTVKDGQPHYTIAFANDQMYDATQKANLLGTVNI